MSKLNRQAKKKTQNGSLQWSTLKIIKHANELQKSGMEKDFPLGRKLLDRMGREGLSEEETCELIPKWLDSHVKKWEKELLLSGSHSVPRGQNKIKNSIGENKERSYENKRRGIEWSKQL